jgi:hypothetical protein
MYYFTVELPILKSLYYLFIELTLQPMRRLTNVLFPAFGAPIMATLSSSESVGISGRSSEIAVCSAKNKDKYCFPDFQKRNYDDLLHL